MGLMYKDSPKVKTVEVWEPPIFRFAAPPGTIQYDKVLGKGSRIEITAKVYNPDGSFHILYFPVDMPDGTTMQVPIDGGQISFDKAPPEGMEVLGVLEMNFVLSPLPVQPTEAI